VSVNIGIALPAPPQLVAVPATPVFYAPAVSANYFFYGGRYYVFTSGVWYASRGHNGPWVVLAPPAVPAPILAVPVKYYRAAPPGWKQWRRDAPPRWSHVPVMRGREYRERDDDKGPPEGRGRDGGKRGPKDRNGHRDRGKSDKR
jgi:hypothetical protein